MIKEFFRKRYIRELSSDYLQEEIDKIWETYKHRWRSSGGKHGLLVGSSFYKHHHGGDLGYFWELTNELERRNAFRPIINPQLYTNKSDKDGNR